MRRNRSLHSRLSYHLSIEPLAPDDTADYARMRPAAVGCNKELFTSDGIAMTRATEIAIVALCASHPRGEQELDERALPRDIEADRIIERGLALLEAVDRYRLLLDDPRALDDPPSIEAIL